MLILKLTRDHSSVSYGQPVMVDQNRTAYGAGDLYPDDPLGRICAEVVAEQFGHLSDEQYEMAVPFCALVGIDIALKPETDPRTDLLAQFYD